MPEVCVDASFALKLVLLEPERDLVRAKFAAWQQNRIVVIAPWLWAFESHSVLWRKVVRAEFTDQRAREAWHILRRQGIHTVHPRGLFDRAWEIATQLARPVTYDAVYAAVAALRGCELWTADQRLINAASGKLGWIRAV
ncbi:MAG: type II toxin-antitoxin system VapC family toxin [Chloroflexota bacterium]